MKKTIRAYIVLNSDKSVELADYFVISDCCCCDATDALAVYGKRSVAKEKLGEYLRFTHSAVPCTITYEIPKKK